MKNKNLKIAMIGHKRIPTREGGVEVVVEELAERMVRRGLSVDAYNRWDNMSRTPEQPREHKGIRIIKVPTFKASSLNAFVYSVLASVRALFGRYDCIHYHAEGPCAMLWLPKLFGIRTVATIHGLDWQRSKWGGFSTWYLKLGEKCAARFADEVIVLSENNRQYFEENYGRRTHYIPNGAPVHDEIYEPREIKERFGLDKGEYVLFLARIVPEKGLHYLIEAFKKIDTDKRLVIAGGLRHGDEYTERIKAMVSGDSRIILADFVSGRLLNELFSNCLVYVLPSDVEGMAMSLLEAVSFGAQCLVSDIPENLEVVGDYMPSFTHGSAESLREELKKLIDGESDNEYDGAGEILAVHDWERITDETISLYSKH